MSDADTNTMFYHFGWMSLVIGMASFCFLTPVMAPVALALGVASGLKGHTYGWGGAVLAFLSGCMWIAMVLTLAGAIGE